LSFSLPLRIHAVEEAVAVFKRLYPYLSDEFCRHSVRYGFRDAGDGTLIPRHDTRMNRLGESEDFEVEELWRLLGNTPCPLMVISGEDSPFCPGRNWKECPCACLQQSLS